MQPIDPKLNEEVWSRVMAGQAGGTGTAAAAADTQEQRAAKMLELMQDERDDAATYRYLARRVCGAEARALQAISDEEACHYRKLGAMYFLLTGKCANLLPTQPECVSCQADALRGRFQAELNGSKAYEAVAQECTPMAQEFHALAADELRHSRIILSLLECRL